MRRFFLFFATMLLATNVMASLQALKLVGNQLCTADNKPIQLHGWSTHEEYEFRTMCDDQTDFAKMKATEANVARIVVKPSYFTANSATILSWVKSCIDYCAKQDLYCIVDWHVADPGDPTNSAYSGASTFFSEIASYVENKNYHHVLYEICGEPNLNEEGTIYEKGQTLWSHIKTYAGNILPVIKTHDPNAIVIVGTPQWCRGLVFPMVDPMDEKEMNVMYGFNLYGDQKASLGILNAATAFIPVFVSQWQLGGFGGTSTLDEGEDVMEKLMRLCRGFNLGQLQISWCAAGWYFADDISAAFSSAENYASSTFTDAGTYLKAKVSSGGSDTRNALAVETQQIDGSHDFYLALEKFDNGSMGDAYWDYDAPFLCGSTSCNGNFGKAGVEDGIREDQSVDLGYTYESHPDDGYISLTYIAEGEWVQYTVNVTVAGDYKFEVYSNNYQSDNIMAIAVDGENALVDADGNEPYKAIQIPPCHEGTTDVSGYSDWDWRYPESPIDPSKQFRIRFKTTGEHKLVLAFMTECAGLGSVRLKGNPTIPTAINNTVVDGTARKELRNGQLLLIRDGRTYNTQGVELR